MDIPNLGTNFSMVREHLQLFSILLFALPSISFLSIKLWIAVRANKVPRTTNWFVPDDLESETARMHYEMGRNSAAFAQRVLRNPGAPAAARSSAMRRRA